MLSIWDPVIYDFVEISAQIVPQLYNFLPNSSGTTLVYNVYSLVIYDRGGSP